MSFDSRSVALALALAAIATEARADGALTLDAYVARVVGGLEAKVAEAELRAAEAARAGTGLWPNPSLEYARQTTAGPDSPPQDVLVASIPLVLSGRLGLERAAAERAAEAAEARRDRARAELRHRATDAFLRLAFAEERERSLATSLNSLTTFVERTAARESAGEASGQERVRMELERALVADAAHEAGLESAQRRAELQRLAGDPSLPAIDPRVPPLPSRPVAEALLAALESKRSDARAEALEADAAELAGRAADARALPDPELSLGPILVDLGGATFGAGLVFGVRAALPVFDAGQGDAAIANARREAAIARRALLVGEARVRLAAALDELARREARLKAHREELLPKAEELARITDAAYAGGEAELSVVVEAERLRREARLAAVGLAEAVRLVENDLLFVAGAYDAATESPVR